jgi:hypothetical protein
MNLVKHTYIAFCSILLGLFITNTTLAQYKWYGENIIANGDFSLGDSLWVIEGGNGTVSHNDTLKFEGVTAGDPWALQSYQSFTAEQIAALATGGDWELTFDAMSPDGAKNFHVFLGQVGGSWARYWPSEAGTGPGDVAVDGEWKTYTLSTTIFETWDAMKLGFEVAADDASLYIDNIQMRKVSNNIVFNGDFSLGDSAWVFEGAADMSVTNGELAFNNIPGTGNTYEVQAHQFFTSGTDGINNKDSIYVGPYQVSFDARSSAESHDLHLFLGEVGGGWARYLDEAGSGKITVDQEMKTYTVNFGVDQVWETMRIGFEVNYGAGDLYIDNVIFTRVDDIKPDAPQVALSSDDGIIKIDVIDNSSAAYDVYFSTAPFSEPRDGRLLATLNSETGLSTTHTIKAPHHSMAKNYTAYVGVIAKSAKGSASEMTFVSINTVTSINENYIFQLNSDAVNTVSDALNEGTVPSGEALAAFFPSDYKPFTISSDANVTVGDKPDDDNDLSGKFWIGYETTTGSDYLIIYSEIKDDLLVPGEWDATTGAPNSGGAWNYDSFEGGFSTYSITDPVIGSPNHQMGAGTSDYQYRIGVTNNADASGYVPYAHAYNLGAINGSVPNSATVAEVTDGMYRTLTLLSIRELSNLEPSNSHIAFPNADGALAIPFHLSLNDNDIIGGSRETQNVWSNRALDGNVWQTPSQWEIVALVGSNNDNDPNLLVNGDFSLGDSAWVFEGEQSDIAITNGELAFTNITGAGNSWEAQAHQFFDPNLLEIGANYKVSFDARTDEGTHQLHVFLGEVGGGWARYFAPDPGSEGVVMIDDQMRTYDLYATIDQVWEVMRLGFEVNYDEGDVFIDNVSIVKVSEKPSLDYIADVFMDTMMHYGPDIMLTVHANDILASDRIESYNLTLPYEQGLTYLDRSIANTHSEDGFLSINDTGDALKIGFASNGYLSGSKPLIHLLFSAETARDYHFHVAELLFNNVHNQKNEGGLIGVVRRVGDVDNDDQILAFDAARVLKYSVGLDPMPEEDPLPWDYWRLGTADVNFDEMILASDASEILQHSVGLRDEFVPFKGKQAIPEVVMYATDKELRFEALSQGLFAMNIEFTKTPDMVFAEPATLEGVLMATNVNDTTFKLAVASSEDLTGNFLTIPINSIVGDEVITVDYFMNNVKGQRNVDMSSWLTSNEGVQNKPTQFELLQNYPNPFNPSTQIQYALPEATQVTLEVFTSIGQKVMELVNGQKSAGYHTATFDASGLSSGVYLYKLTTPSFTETKKMLLIK